VAAWEFSESATRFLLASTVAWPVVCTAPSEILPPFLNGQGPVLVLVSRIKEWPRTSLLPADFSIAVAVELFEATSAASLLCDRRGPQRQRED
jgi:hypothetical protein